MKLGLVTLTPKQAKDRRTVSELLAAGYSLQVVR